jgi:hypothetical protein
MTSSVSLATALSQLAPFAGEAIKRFHRQPTLLSIASDTIRDILRNLEPPILLDPEDVAMAWPSEPSINGGIECIPLPQLLIDLCVGEKVLTLVKGYQTFRQRQAGGWVPLNMDGKRLAEEIDARRPTLIEAFEEALVLFWGATGTDGKTHWAWLGDYLCDAFRHQLEAARLEGEIPADVYTAGLSVIANRTASPTHAPRAWLLQLQQGGTALPFDSRLDPHLLIAFETNGVNAQYLLFSPVNKLRYCASRQALLATVAARLNTDGRESNTELQPVEPQGDVFTALARTLLQTQLIELEVLTDWARKSDGPVRTQRLKVASDIITSFYFVDVRHEIEVGKRLRQALPDWLSKASALDRWHYAIALSKLAVSGVQASGAWFLDGIPTLEAYAHRRLVEEAARLHSSEPALEPGNIVASVEYVEADLIDITGGPTHAHFREEPLNVTDLVIDNLAAHSRGRIKVAAKPGTTLPRWLDGDALQALVQTIDVGKTYPDLLREQLLTGPGASERKVLFGQQMMLQLPLLAWELMLREACGLDREGCSLVEEGVGVTLIENPTRLLALGVTPGSGYGTDSIAATYVFRREDAPTGPCVLYRPLHAEPLHQYRSMDALWDDLCAPGALQDEALRWMTDTGRTRYSHGGFRAPRVVRFGQGDEFMPLTQPQPARPVLSVLPSPFLDTLYQEVIQALIGMAERRSVSNAENRWVSLGQLANTLFAGLLPIFSGPLATAAWLIQISEAFSDYLETRNTSGETAKSARDDLLLTVVLLLLSEAVHWPLNEPARVRAHGDEAVEHPAVPESEHITVPVQPVEAGVAAPEQSFLELVTTPVPEAIAAPRLRDFDLSWASAGMSLDSTQLKGLQALRARLPLRPLSPIPHGPGKGLYLYDESFLLEWQGHYYAVGFEEGNARIIGPDDQPGPYLRSDETGRWALDLRLRLRGGGPKRRIEARRLQNARDREQGERLYTDIMVAFDTLRDNVNPLGERLDAAASRGESRIADREKLDAILHKGYQHCAGQMELYAALHSATPMPDFAERQCQMLVRQLHISKVMGDNLSELTREYVTSTPYMGGSEKALRELVLKNIAQWEAFLERFQDLTERSIDYAERHIATVNRIKTFSGLGDKVLAENSEIVQPLHSVLELRSSLAYSRLGQVLEPFRANPQLAERMHKALEPVLIHSASHADLATDPGVPVPEKMQVLDTAIRQYQKAEDAIDVFKETLESDTESANLDRFKALTALLREDAEERLGTLVRTSLTEIEPVPPKPSQPQRNPRPRPKSAAKGNAKPGTSGSAQATGSGSAGGANEAALAAQVIHTAEGDTLMAHVRTDERRNIRVAEVVSNNQVLATWQQTAAGEWKKVVRSVAGADKESTRQLNTFIHEANRVVDEVNRDLAQVARFKQVTRIPVDIQDQYHGHAQRLDDLAQGIEEALTQLNATDAATDEHGSAERKAGELRHLANTARQVGTQARIDLSKSLLPTGGRLEFLLAQGEVTIHRLGDRAPLGRAGRRDYVQEYEIRDSLGHPLWYAHFHYDTATARDAHYTAAHLKTVTQRFDGYQKQLQQARGNEEVIGIYRSQIDPVLARRLFLSLQ